MKNNPLGETIEKKLIACIKGKMSLGSFRDWFIPATWNVDEWGSDQLQKQVYGIKLRLAEFTNGHWAEVELRAKLIEFAGSYTVTSSSYGFTDDPGIVWNFQSQEIGRRPAVAFA